MAKKSSRSGGGAGKVLIGFLLGVATVAGAGYAWLHYAGTPRALRGKLPPLFAGLVKDPLKSEAGHAKRTPPFGISEDVFEGGAHVYQAKCANCHGVPGHDAAFGRQMNPAASQLWKRGATVSAVDAGETYTKIASGVPRSGMPGFASTLSDTEIWQVSLLLRNADKELPDPVLQILKGK